jgi:DNA-binding transcriptional ArsR family regulator
VSVEPVVAVTSRSAGWRGVHRALADPLRIRLFEALWHGSRSVKELALEIGLPPDRLYYHLRQLEHAGIVEVAEFRRLPSGKAERVYRRAEVEPPSDVSSPEEMATFLGSVLDASKADVTAAFMARATGERREAIVSQGVLRLDERELADLRARIGELEHRWQQPDDGEGTAMRLLFAAVDLEDRPETRSQGRPTRAVHGAT